MVDIFREVDEEVRQQRYRELWQKYGAYVIGLAVVIILLVAGYQGWISHQDSTRAEASDRYIALMEALQSDEEAALDELFAFSEVWRRIAANASAGPALQGAAELTDIIHSVDRVEPEILQERLSALMANNAAYSSLAQEVSAMVALRSGDKELAVERLRELSVDLTAPESLRLRASRLLNVLEDPNSGAW